MRSTLALPVLLTFAVAAQQPSLPDGVGIHATGVRPGTMRYVAMFAQRDFDLNGFRSAVLARRPAAEIDAIVADLERRARAAHKPFSAAVEQAGGQVHMHWWLIDGCAFEVAPGAVDALRRLENVRTVEADHTTMPLILVSTNASNHNSDAVNAAGNRGASQTVAIMDTGLDSVSGATGKPHATFYVNGDNNNTTGGGIGGSRMLANVQMGAMPPDNTHPHGTGVAGIAAGAKWFNDARYDDGHAPLAKIVGYSIANSSSGQALESVMAATWQRIAADRVRYNIAAANNSYTGYACNVLNVIQQAIDAAVYNADVVAVVAAGNSTSNTTYSQPCANGLAVAATNATTKTMASFSCYGPLSCPDSQQFWPDISACGVNTVMPQIDNAAAAYTGSGTSMASPQVCGAAALVRNSNPSLNAQETKAILLCTTESIAAQNAARTRMNYGQGFLRDDLATMLAQVPGSAFTRQIASTTTPNLHRISVTANQPVRIVMCWPRRLGTSNSSAWSDLTLRVLDGTNVVASSDDLRQLYETVRFTPANSGVLTIEVAAKSLEGNQPIEYSIAHDATPLGYVPGTFALYGSGCTGSNGVPVLGAAGAPTLGASWRVTLSSARASAPAMIGIGASRTNWGSVALPWPIPGAPNCFVNASLDAVAVLTSEANGTAAVQIGVPVSPSLIGQSAYLQWAIADAVNALGVVTTAGGAAVVGGLP
jgi:hypothetical protein